MWFMFGMLTGYAATSILFMAFIAVIVWAGSDITIQRYSEPDEKAEDEPREQTKVNSWREM